MRRSFLLRTLDKDKTTQYIKVAHQYLPYRKLKLIVCFLVLFPLFVRRIQRGTEQIVEIQANLRCIQTDCLDRREKL